MGRVILPLHVNGKLKVCTRDRIIHLYVPLVEEKPKCCFFFTFCPKTANCGEIYIQVTVYLEEGWFCIFIIKTLTFVICFILRSVYCTLSDQRVLQFWNIPTACYFTKVYNMLENIMIIND